MTLPSPTQLAASSNVPAAGLSAPADARPADAASHSSKRPGPPADEKGHPLTQAVILRNLPEATLSRHGTGASCLPRLFRLDLGLERLSSLQGLDVICPRLRTLSADANRLSSLDGVAGLSGLQELSLRQNQLGSLLRPGQGAAGRATGVLPSGRTLRWLALDANKLSGPLRGLSGCSGLRSLSLADNSLTDLGSELEACSPQLLSLSVRTNQLTSMHRQLLSLTNLRDLDVGGNRLATLDGIQGLLLLQSLRASGNAICSLPQPLCLPYLTSLELGQNRLTAFGDVGDGAAGGQLDCPRLRRLVLQENSIARLGALGPMVHLTSLDLSFNSLASLDAIHAVTHLSALRTLNLSNNPITDQPIPAVQASVGMRWAEGLAQVALGRVRGPGGGAAPNGGGAGSDSRISTRWALPCLQELNLDGVERPHRMAGVVRACTASPSSAVTGTRRMRGSSACFLVCHAASSACSSVAFGRQARAASPQARQTAGGLVSQRSLMRFAADIRGAAEPAAVQSLLVAAAGPPFGSAAASGLHAEMTATAGLGSKRLTPSAASVRSDAAGSCTAEGWLSRVGRAWHAASPLETLGLQSRMLAVAERGASLDDAALQGSPGGPAAGERLVDAVGSVLASSSLVAMAGLAHGGADLGDFVTMRCFRPLARAARRLAAAGASPCGAAAPPEAHAHAAQLLRGTEAGRDSEAVWALITEAHGRFEALLAGAELEAAQEFKHQLIGRSTDSNPQLALSVKPQLFVAARPSYTLRCMCTAVGGAATKIQAAWRGFRTRKMLPQLRVEACDAEVLRRRAATTIQAWWRGHCVRRAKLLSALREAAQRSQAESRRREAAATRIQAHFRGHLVRKKLRKALAAVRFPAVPRGDSDLDSLGSDDLDAMLEGLAPIEKLLMDEVADVSRSAALPPEAAREPWRAAPQRDSGSGWQPGGLQGHLLPSSYGGAGSASTFGVPQAAFAGGARADLGAGSGLHAGLLGASAATDPPVPELHRPMLPGHGPLPVLQPQISLLPPQSAARPYVSQQVPHLQRGIGAPAMGMSPHSELATDQRPREVDQAAPPTHSAAAFASPAFHTARLPPISLRSSTPNSPHPAGLQGFSPQYMQEGAMLSPGFSEPSGEDMCNERGAAMMESASTEERCGGG
uniref:Toll-like receptor, homolog of Volvox carteri MTF1458/MTM0638 n=1 Tax=Eudorina sp. NIES-3984 TaxID=1941220 RepID=A0A2Z5X8G6_9CHLO|nr:Toll-like receptor, homolog of Volvox carteri MTF1458/MTM0638 [Eudorina sp. NIES-3984]